MHIIVHFKSGVACACQTVTLWTDHTRSPFPPSSAQIMVLAQLSESCVTMEQKLHHCPGLLSSQEKGITNCLGNA